jgi:hypothetical protein
MTTVNVHFDVNLGLGYGDHECPYSPLASGKIEPRMAYR